MTIKGLGGRPLHFKSIKQLDDLITEYFDVDLKPSLIMSDEGKPVMHPKTGAPLYDHKVPTIAGLCLKLDFAERKSIYNYMQRYGKPDHEHHKFALSIKKAIMRIEVLHEGNLQNAGAAGSIFWLKNRGGFIWNDKTDVNLSGEVGTKQMGTITKDIVKKGKIVGKETLTFNVGEEVKKGDEFDDE